DTLFQVSKHRITGDITAKFAGFNFNATEFQSTNNTGFKTPGIYMDSADEQFSLGDNIWFENGQGFLGKLTVEDVLNVPGGNTKIGKGIYTSPGLSGKRDGIISGGVLISEHGIDIDARDALGS